jgi:excisionase family DNA binding protein
MESMVYNVKETAGLLKVSSDTIYELVRQGRLKCIRMGKAIRIPKKYIDQFIDEEVK